jgi:tetratricopeptide (TPR) repeat protein
MTRGSRLRQDYLVGGALVLLAGAVYANALANGLVWDDPIVLNRQLLAFKSLRDLVFTPRNIPQYSPDYYRPVTTLSYLIDRAIGGTSPFLFHLSVVLYHLVATALVFGLGLSLFADLPGRLPAAGMGAALFAVHPIHTESVAWGAGRSDVLACCFALAATLVYLGARWTPWRRALVAAALVFVAALAKETAVALFLILPGSDVLLGRPSAPTAPAARRAERRRQRRRDVPHSSSVLLYAPFAVALCGYVLLRQAALGTLFGQAKPLGNGGVRTFLAAVGLYAAKLVLPLRQSAYISDLPTSPLALLAVAAVLTAALLASVTAWRRGERRALFLVVWTGLTLTPSLAIVVKLPGAPVAERYLYLPSVGFCLLCGYAAARLLQAVTSRRARTAVLLVVGVIIVAAAVGTVRRNAVWRSNLSLWSDTAAKNTTDGLPMRSLAAAYLTLGDTAKAAECFRRALQRRNDQLGTFIISNNLGSLAMHDKQLDAAEGHYTAALAIDPNAPDALFNLGLISLTRAMESDSTRSDSWKREQAQRARQLFERAALLSPLDPDIQVALGQALSFLGNSAGARARYTRALELGVPPSTEASIRNLLAALE